MRKRNGFTLIEVLFSIMVFSIGILAYMQFQAQASAVLYDTESSIIANQIAMELAEQVNSMSEESFSRLNTMIDTQLGTASPSAWRLDNYFKAYAGDMLQFSPGPFDTFGKPLEAINGTGHYYRLVRRRTYNEMSGMSYLPDTPLEVLRIIEIVVAWPKKDFPTQACNAMPLSANCDLISLVVIKPLI